MIATMEHVALLDLTDDLMVMLKQSDIYLSYIQEKDKLKNNIESQELISTFLKIRDKYDEVQRFGKYHPDYKSVIQDMMDVKRNLDMDDQIASFKQAEKNLEELLGGISQEVAHAVSSSIKVPTGDPFFDRGCSGGCGSGGACGCH